MDIAIISQWVSLVILPIAGFVVGKKKSDAEAIRTMTEAYDFALQSLRKEFEARDRAKDLMIEKLNTRINELEEILKRNNIPSV